MLSKRQVKILKILKNRELTFEKLSNVLNTDINSLYEIMGGEFDKYIKPVSTSPTTITLSEVGLALLHQLQKEHVRFWIPVFMSILALITGVVGWFFPL